MIETKTLAAAAIGGGAALLVLPPGPVMVFGLAGTGLSLIFFRQSSRLHDAAALVLGLAASFLLHDLGSALVPPFHTLVWAQATCALLAGLFSGPIVRGAVVLAKGWENDPTSIAQRIGDVWRALTGKGGAP